MDDGGWRLRDLRQRLGLSVRDVQRASEKLASKHRNPDLLINKARLSDIESKGVLPNLYKLYSLAAIYKQTLGDLLGLYGVDVNLLPSDMADTRIPSTRLIRAAEISAVRMPVQLEPVLDLRETTNLGRLIAKWGTLPLTLLSAFENSSFTFGYIGDEDRTMFPLLQPGSFIQVDESKRRIEEGSWATEYERPIYFIEARAGFACAWCSVEGTNLVVQPHPLSGQRVRLYRFGHDAEIIGQVVGVAMRLDQKRYSVARQSSTARTISSQNVPASPPPVREDS
jgi:transcriptional regulator with XRE-family HTH domain